jgi:hypothetical protein
MPHIPAQEGEHHTLGENLLHDVLRPGADGAADAYLGGAFTDGDHHDVAHTDDTGQQGAQSDEPYQ